MYNNFLVIIFILTQLVSTAIGDGDGFIFNGFGANISLDGAAEITNDGMLRLTSITTYNQIGHAFFYRPLIFEDPSTNSSFSFSSNFVIQLVPRSRDYSGNGMAFVIAPTKDLTACQPGGYLGILNSTNNGSSSNHLLAVEFDTVPNTEFLDPDFNHVGIDINSMVSVNFSQVGYYRNDDGTFVPLSHWIGDPIQVWVDYDAGRRQISVTISPLDVPMPNIPLVTANIDLSTVFLKSMYVGFSAAINYVQTAHYVNGWSFMVNGQAQQLDLRDLPVAPRLFGSSGRRQSVLIPALVSVAAIIIIIIILVVAFIIVRRYRNASSREDPIAYRPQKISYDEIRRATNRFSDGNFLGQGGSGKVYRGVIPRTENLVAVKVIHHDNELRMKEFYSEIKTVGSIRHQNLVRLLGYSEGHRRLILVYDFMPNGSLEKYLYGHSQVTLLWSQRFQIINQVASALCFLHQHLPQVVVHRDIKASNVLLDIDFNAKLGDFGLSRLYDHGEVHHTSRPAGTIGYIAPEAGSGQVSPKADVFAFGILMLELACGRRPVDLAQSPGKVILKDWVAECFSGDQFFNVVDRRLGDDFVEMEMELVLKIGLMCSGHSVSFRPSMAEVIQYLNGHARLREFTVRDLTPDHPRQEERGGPHAPTMSPSSDSLNSFYTDLSHRELRERFKRKYKRGWLQKHPPPTTWSNFTLSAGGINTENVCEAVATLKPDGVDVSSAICGPDGIKKDSNNISSFTSKIRSSGYKL